MITDAAQKQNSKTIYSVMQQLDSLKNLVIAPVTVCWSVQQLQQISNPKDFLWMFPESVTEKHEGVIYPQTNVLTLA